MRVRDMSSSNRSRDSYTQGTANTPAAPTGAGPEPFATWSDRMQRARGRHSAITRNLNTWSNYKNWAERVKTDWPEGD